MAGPDGAWHENVEGNREGGDADVGDVDLRLLIRAEGATGFAAALLVLKGALVALAAAHRDGITHPDLAPENVIVTPAGRIRLAGDPAEAHACRAPELWRGAPASPASDIYAATAVFFECLTGGPPFHASGAVRLGLLHRTVPPPVEQAPEALRGLVERGLSKAPQHRPPSAAVFAAEVEAVAVAALGPDWERPGRVVLAALASSHTSAAPEPVRPPAARPSRVRIATMVALTAAAVVMVAVSAGDRPSRQSHQAAPPPPPAVTLLPTPSFAAVQPVENVENSEPIPARKPVVIAEETGSPRSAAPTDSSTPTPKPKDEPKDSTPESQAPAETDEPATVPETEPTQQPPPPASEPTSAPIVEVEADLPIVGGLDVSVGVQTGLLGLELSL
jgi:serine/threonine-protein kinase